MAKQFLEPVPPSQDGDSKQPLTKRLAWFFGISITSAIVVVAFAYALRHLLFLE